MEGMPSELAEMPAAKRGGPLAQRITAARRQLALLRAVERASARGRTVVPSEAARIMGGTDPAWARVNLVALAEAGVIQRTGNMRRAYGEQGGRTAIEFAVLPSRTPAPKEEEDEGKLAPEDASKLRDYVVSQRRGFTPAGAAKATELSEDSVRAALPAMIRRGIIRFVGMDGLDLYEYVPPRDPGAAARLQHGGGNGNGAATNGSAPVPGTGRGLRAGRAMVNDLLRRARKAGGEVQTQGNGHFVVINPQNKQRVRVASSPEGSSMKKSERELRAIGIMV